MAEETRTKRAFHEDIFAEDPDKWSWPVMGSNSKATSSGGNYTSEVKSDSSRSSDSANGFLFRDSESPKKSKVGSSSDIQEDASSSSRPSDVGPRERLLPSIYDDDAQSGSPSGVFEKKDLAFQSSFKKSFASSRDRSRSKEKSPVDKDSEKTHRSVTVDDDNSGLSPGRKDFLDCRPLNSFADALPKSSRSRSKSREVHSRRRSRTRSRSKDRRVRSPRRDRRRSRSRDKRSERERVRRGRARRSRSRESRGHRSYHGSSSRDKYRRRHRISRRYSRSRSHSREHSKSGSGGHKPGSLSLSTSGGAMTPQMALQQTMAAMSAKAQALTGIALPKYYNPAAVNPLKYAEQVQKRKLLWQSKEKVEQEQPQPKNTVWDKLTFAQDQDGKMTAKFRKLMGIKSEENGGTEAEEKESVLKKQEELFRNLDQQYEMARMTTHTQRGVGLGYSAQPLYPPAPKQ